jgi:hypothetical protein
MKTKIELAANILGLRSAFELRQYARREHYGQRRVGHQAEGIPADT